MLAAALQLLEPEVNAIVEQKVQQQLNQMPPVGMSMARGNSTIPIPPPQSSYQAWLRSKAPAAPPLELYQTWIRNRAAITIQMHFRSSLKSISRHVLKVLTGLSDEAKAPAISINSDMDSIRGVIVGCLGTNAFKRAVFNAPNDWEEHQMISAMRDLVHRPTQSVFLWLLARPTRSERQLLNLAGTVSKSKESQREVRAALKIQKLFRGRSTRLVAMVRFQMQGLAREAAAVACSKGIDAIRDLIEGHLGKNVWRRAVVNAPDDWEEDQMVHALTDALASPATSPNVWLLAKPLKMERMLMTAFSTKVKAFNANL